MLVLTRTLDKPTTYIGDDVQVIVLRIKGNSVRLGFVAPGGVHIVRAELVDDQDDDEPTEEEHGV